MIFDWIEMAATIEARGESLTVKSPGVRSDVVWTEVCSHLQFCGELGGYTRSLAGWLTFDLA